MVHSKMHEWSNKVIILANGQMLMTTDALSFKRGSWWGPFGHSREPLLPSLGYISDDARELSRVKSTFKVGL